MNPEECIDLKHAEIRVSEMSAPLIRYELREILIGAGFRMKPTPDVIESVKEVIDSIEEPWNRIQTLSGVVHFYQGPGERK